MSAREKVTEGSGNVFADLGLPDADELLTKAKLAHEISRIIEGRGLSQTQASKLLGIDQPKVSALVRGRLSGFSTDRLLRFLVALGCDVNITIRRRRRKGRRARVDVLAA